MSGMWGLPCGTTCSVEFFESKYVFGNVMSISHTHKHRNLWRSDEIYSDYISGNVSGLIFTFFISLSSPPPPTPTPTLSICSLSFCPASHTDMSDTTDNHNNQTSTYAQSQNPHRHPHLLRWTLFALAPHQTSLLSPFCRQHWPHPDFWCLASGWSTVLQSPPGLTAFVAAPPQCSPAAVLSTPPVSQYSWLCVARWRCSPSIWRRREKCQSLLWYRAILVLLVQGCGMIMTCLLVNLKENLWLWLCQHTVCRSVTCGWLVAENSFEWHPAWSGRGWWTKELSLTLPSISRVVWCTTWSVAVSLSGHFIWAWAKEHTVPTTAQSR